MITLVSQSDWFPIHRILSNIPQSGIKTNNLVLTVIRQEITGFDTRKFSKYRMKLHSDVGLFIIIFSGVKKEISNQNDPFT